MNFNVFGSSGKGMKKEKENGEKVFPSSSPGPSTCLSPDSTMTRLQCKLLSQTDWTFMAFLGAIRPTDRLLDT